MKSLRVLLIETQNSNKLSLKKKLLNLNSIKLIITDAEITNAEAIFKDAGDRLDVILFSKQISSSAILHLTKIFRAHNTIVPIFILSKQSEAKVPRKYNKVGVDDVLNIAEINTPLFGWTFMSAVEHAILKKKAKEYDVLYHRLKATNDSLASLMHEINNPLSVIRLAMYHLEDPNLPVGKKETFLKILLGSLEKIDIHMKELRSIRRQLNFEKAPSAKILSIKPALNISATN